MISIVKFNNLKKELLSVRRNKQSIERTKSKQKSSLYELEAELLRIPHQLKDSTDIIDLEINKISQELLRLNSNYELMVVSPVSGKVNNLQVKIGQRISRDIPFLNIVPVDSEITVKLLVPIRAVGFIEVGQEVSIRYTAFPYQKFGTYKARITVIPDSVLLPNEINNLPVHLKEAVYLVEAKLNSQKITAYNKEIQLKNGMSLTADIILSERSLIDWLLEPISSLNGLRNG